MPENIVIWLDDDGETRASWESKYKGEASWIVAILMDGEPLAHAIYGPDGETKVGVED